MPIWERYEVEAVTSVRIKSGDKVIAEFQTSGEAKADSNEEISSLLTITQAVTSACSQALFDAETMAGAARSNIRKRLGYGD